MSFDVKVLADSRSPAGYRLTTLEATFPRFVLAEFNTHRVFSRNSASSRAIPIAKQLRRVLEEPYVPIEFGSNQPGMQAGAALAGEKRDAAEHEWLRARDDAVRRVLGLIADPDAFSADEDLLEILEQVEAAIRDRTQPAEWLNVHKQVANRLLEPFMWHTVIVTATEWDNFWNLRCHPDAQPEIRLVAETMRDAMEASEPERTGRRRVAPAARPSRRPRAGRIDRGPDQDLGRSLRQGQLPDPRRQARPRRRHPAPRPSARERPHVSAGAPRTTAHRHRARRRASGAATSAAGFPTVRASPGRRTRWALRCPRGPRLSNSSQQ